MDIAPLALLVLFFIACILWWRERMRAQHLLREQHRRNAELMRTTERCESLARLHRSAEERERLYADGHAAIRAQLENLLASGPVAAQADLARALLQHLDATAALIDDVPRTLSETLQAVRSEATRRLTTPAARLDWDCAENLPDLPLAPDQALRLLRRVRETLDELLEDQGQALCIRIDRTGAKLTFEITHENATHVPREAIVRFALPRADTGA